MFVNERERERERERESNNNHKKKNSYIYQNSKKNALDMRGHPYEGK